MLYVSCLKTVVKSTDALHGICKSAKVLCTSYERES